MLSLEKKLPLLIGGLVAGVVVIVSTIAVAQVRSAARDAAVDRLDRVGHEMSDFAADGLAGLRTLLARAAGADEVLALARGSRADSAAAMEELQRLRQPQDSSAWVQVLDRSGRLLAATAQSAREVPLDPDSGRLPGGIGAPIEQEGRGAFWLEVPIVAGSDTLGWLRQRRPVGSPETREQFRTFLGDNIEIHFGDRAGGNWISLDGTIIAPRAGDERPRTVQYERDGIRYLARIDTVPGLPWSVITEMNQPSIYARVGAVLRDLALAGVLLLLLGGLAAWAISRQVTRPLRELGRAADAIAHGEYERRAGIDRDDELGRLASTFNTMAERIAVSHEELAHASRSKSEFLATMSHEIRTPINAVIGYADLLEAGTAGELDPRQRAFLDRIRASGRHLTDLVNEVLDFSKIEAGVMSLHPGVHPVRTVVQAAVSLMASQAAQKGVAITLAESPELSFHADPQRVHQILINILSNAVKFTPPSGDVVVRWSAVEHRVPGAAALPAVAIEVADTGVGIAEEFHDRIFEPFVQASSGYTREHGGTGLGLAISRRMARLMGGDITVRSTPGSGAAFTVVLPRAV